MLLLHLHDNSEINPICALLNSLCLLQCNVHQSTPKIRSRTKKCANQNGRPSRSLKSKKSSRERTKEETPPRRKREEDDTPTKRHVVRPGIVPSHSEIASSLRRNGPVSRYPIFKEELENCRIDERTLEMSVLINLDVIIVYLQLYGNAGSARSLYWYFWRLFS